MDIRSKVNSSRTMRLFNTELYDSTARQMTGDGKRIGLEVSSLSRIQVLRDGWKSISSAIQDLELVAHYPRFPRQPSYEYVCSIDWVFHEEVGKILQANIKVSDDTYVMVEDPKKKGLWLSVAIDRRDFEDVRVTTYRPFKLENGEEMRMGDLRLIQPIHPNPTMTHREPIPIDWVGQRLNEEVHGSLKRQQSAVVTPLSEVIT